MTPSCEKWEWFEVFFGTSLIPARTTLPDTKIRNIRPMKLSKWCDNVKVSKTCTTGRVKCPVKIWFYISTADLKKLFGHVFIISRARQISPRSTWRRYLTVLPPFSTCLSVVSRLFFPVLRNIKKGDLALWICSWCESFNFYKVFASSQRSIQRPGLAVKKYN